MLLIEQIRVPSFTVEPVENAYWAQKERRLANASENAHRKRTSGERQASNLPILIREPEKHRALSCLISHRCAATRM